jgi:hypothetical protein
VVMRHPGSKQITSTSFPSSAVVAAAAIRLNIRAQQTDARRYTRSCRDGDGDSDLQLRETRQPTVDSHHCDKCRWLKLPPSRIRASVYRVLWELGNVAHVWRTPVYNDLRVDDMSDLQAQRPGWGLGGFAEQSCSVPELRITSSRNES